MYNGGNNIYIRESLSRVELLENKKLIRFYTKIKGMVLKRIYNFFLKSIININFFIKKIIGKPIKRKMVNGDVNVLLLTSKGKINKKSINKLEKRITSLKGNLVFSDKVLKSMNIDFSDKKDVFKVLDGKILMSSMLDKVLIYIMQHTGERIEEKTIYILVNNFENNLELIKYIAGIVKSVNIVTNKIKEFQWFADRLYNSNGIMASVSNNKRKSIRRAKLIVNIDFESEELLSYNLNRSSLIINLSKNVLSIDKAFEGIIINSLEIKNVKVCKVYRKSVYYESLLVKYNDYLSRIDKIKKDKIEVEYLIGNRGKIEKAEYAKIA